MRAPLIDVHEHGDTRPLDQRAHSLSLGSGVCHVSSFSPARGIAGAHNSSESATLVAMEKPKVLTAKGLRAIMPRLSGWKLAQNKLSRAFEFQDFVQSLSFVNSLVAISRPWIINPTSVSRMVR